ncbi:F-box only protein 40 isoform X1 [Eucyclogobius newberryi]|uniref:F-box only protein 40 isoform X1 n=1 Tax=Eucyclogobius newberryi TaxID=166745 RepID=UPI003B5C6F09
MIVRRRMPSAAGQHRHCDKCHNLHCQVSTPCVVIKCRKNCGACLHLCKEEDHCLLCPNETVPCINASFGCPLTMYRFRLAQHLPACPASVVCCSQDWNRWPIPDDNPPFYTNISKDLQTRQPLDVAMALRDQEILFQSIKMKSVFPELMVVDLCHDKLPVVGELDECGCGETEELSQKERHAMAKSRNVENIQSYNSWEKMFKKEMDGCKETVKNLEKKEERGEEKAGEESHSCQRETRGEYHLSNGHGDAALAASALGEAGATGLAPWHDGVLDRLAKEVHISEYNRYIMSNGAMLINFGQMPACTPREKDFVYGKLEPIEVKSVRSFNAPTSYRARRSYLNDPSRKVKRAHQSVDTADLDVSIEALPKGCEVTMTLLCALEKELKGHSISQNTSSDRLFDDVGTQTYHFHSAPFQTDASLVNIAPNHNSLYVNIETESVTRRHNRRSSAFSFICGHFFRRDEFSSHFKNVHLDIQSCLNGWFQPRCPLAYLGCTYTQTRFHPSGQRATIKYCQDVNVLVLQPQAFSSSSNVCQNKKINTQRDHLSKLPLEVLQYIVCYLDNFTLSQLSQTSCLMRDVCAALLQERGMVFLKWEKKTDSQGRSAWRCQEKVWTFSYVFSTVDKWSFSDNPSMSEHLKSCPYYQREEQLEPVALPGLGEIADRQTGLFCPSR